MNIASKGFYCEKNFYKLKNQDALIFVKFNCRYRFYDCGEFDEVNKLGYNQRTK